MKTKINAWCCFCESTSKSKIILEKSHYYAGEPLKIRIECDNSASSRDIVGFDFALRRHHQATDRGLNASYYEMEADYESIVRKEEKGLGARQKKTFEFELQIPTEDPPVEYCYNRHIE